MKLLKQLPFILLFSSWLLIGLLIITIASKHKKEDRDLIERELRLRHAIASLTVTRDELHQQVLNEREILRQLQSEIQLSKHDQKIELEEHLFLTNYDYTLRVRTNMTIKIQVQ